MLSGLLMDASAVKVIGRAGVRQALTDNAIARLTGTVTRCLHDLKGGFLPSLQAAIEPILTSISGLSSLHRSW